jgi:hypothetical protein
MKISRDEKRMSAGTSDRRTDLKYKGTLMNEIFRFLEFKVSLINSGRPEIVEGRLTQRTDFPASSVHGSTGLS